MKQTNKKQTDQRRRSKEGNTQRWNSGCLSEL